MCNAPLSQPLVCTCAATLRPGKTMVIDRSRCPIHAARPCPHPSDCNANGCAGKCDEAVTSRMRPGAEDSQASTDE